jgi:hypothetical protein
VIRNSRRGSSRDRFLGSAGYELPGKDHPLSTEDLT